MDFMFYRPVFYGLATKKEIEVMTYKELLHINEIVTKLAKEQAIFNANQIGELFGDDDSKGGN